jgi:hypothetical protein
MPRGKIASVVAAISDAIGRTVAKEGFNPAPEIISAERCGAG